MKIEALPDDFIDELISGSQTPQADEYDGPKMQLCPHCGSCADPEHCVWGVQCPKCFAPPHQHCLDDRGALTGLHQERWDYAKTSWRIG